MSTNNLTNTSRELKLPRRFRQQNKVDGRVLALPATKVSVSILEMKMAALLNYFRR